jgi:hypothetical protein
VGVVLGRDPLLFGKTIPFISLSAFTNCAFADVESDGSVDDRSRTLLPGSYTLHEHGRVSHRGFLPEVRRLRFVRAGTVELLLRAR